MDITAALETDRPVGIVSRVAPQDLVQFDRRRFQSRHVLAFDRRRNRRRDRKRFAGTAR